MDSLKRVLARVLAQTRGLTGAHKLTLLLGALLVGVSLTWLGQWAAKPEMVPLLDQTLAPEELASLRTGLDLMREPYRIDGTRVLVGATVNRPAVLAQLQQSNHMPTDTSQGFAALVKESNPWISQSDQRKRWTVALAYELKSVLRTFAGVADADVFLNIESSTRLVERNPAPPSASVTLEMKGGSNVPRELALAAARLVAGAVAGMKAENVQVVDKSGHAALDWEDTTAGGSGQLHREQTQREREMTQKIFAIFSDPHLRVNVRVELDPSDHTTQIQEPSAGVERETNTTSTIDNRGGAAQQPGVAPNTGTADLGGGGGTDHSESNTTRTQFEVGVKSESTTTLRGDVRAVFAAISLSDSYLTSLFLRSNPGGKAPTPEQLQTVFDALKPRVVALVTPLVKAAETSTASANVAVDWHYEVPDEAPTTQAASGALDDAWGLARRYGPQGGLAVLALGSLGLMLRMARKTTGGESFGLEIGLPKDAIEAARKAAEDVNQVAAKLKTEQAQKDAAARRGVPPGTGPNGEPPISQTMAAVAQAQVTEGVLVAQEVDESAVQINKMVQQVATFVDKDPETVGNLLERWIQSQD